MTHDPYHTDPYDPYDPYGGQEDPTLPDAGDGVLIQPGDTEAVIPVTADVPAGATVIVDISTPIATPPGTAPVVGDIQDSAGNTYVVDRSVRGNFFRLARFRAVDIPADMPAGSTITISNLPAGRTGVGSAVAYYATGLTPGGALSGPNQIAAGELTVGQPAESNPITITQTPSTIFGFYTRLGSLQSTSPTVGGFDVVAARSAPADISNASVRQGMLVVDTPGTYTWSIPVVGSVPPGTRYAMFLMALPGDATVIPVPPDSDIPEGALVRWQKGHKAPTYIQKTPSDPPNPPEGAQVHWVKGAKDARYIQSAAGAGPPVESWPNEAEVDPYDPYDDPYDPYDDPYGS